MKKLRLITLSLPLLTFSFMSAGKELPLEQLIEEGAGASSHANVPERREIFSLQPEEKTVSARQSTWQQVQEWYTSWKTAFTTWVTENTYQAYFALSLPIMVGGVHAAKKQKRTTQASHRPQQERDIAWEENGLPTQRGVKGAFPPIPPGILMFNQGGGSLFEGSGALLLPPVFSRPDEEATWLEESKTAEADEKMEESVGERTPEEEVTAQPPTAIVNPGLLAPEETGFNRPSHRETAIQIIAKPLQLLSTEAIIALVKEKEREMHTYSAGFHRDFRKSYLILLTAAAQRILEARGQQTYMLEWDYAPCDDRKDAQRDSNALTEEEVARFMLGSAL